MASASFEWEGLDELKEILRYFPAHLTAAASAEIMDEANGAAAEIREDYPEVSGNLKGHVSVVQLSAGEFGAAAQVRSTAKHAHLYEYGTQTRQTDLGYNRGAMPAKPVVGAVMGRRRRQLYRRLIRMMELEGLEVRE